MSSKSVPFSSEFLPQQATLTPTRGTFFQKVHQNSGAPVRNRVGRTLRAQTTIELMTILAVALVILTVLISFTAEQVNNVQKQRAIKTAELAIQTIVNASNEVYAQGPGASRYIQLAWPEGVSSTGTLVSNHGMALNVFDTQVFGETIPILTGSLPTTSGLQNIRIRSFDGFVLIGEVSFTMSPSTVLSTLSRSSTSSTRITLTNLLLDDAASAQAAISISTSWSHSDVNIAVSPSSGDLYGGGTFTFDVNFNSNSSAVGTYTGDATIIATYPSSVQTLVLPLQANVHVGGTAQLVAFPTSISLSTFGIDTNSTTIQLCNVGATEIKTISITPSSGTPGTWISPFATIDSLAAQSCQAVDVNVSVPTDTLGTHYGSLAVSDYTGANSISIPTTISVLGMSSAFTWDWSPAVRSVNTILDFALTNTGRKPVRITHVTLHDWWNCDSAHSYWTQFRVDNNSRFSGYAADGNTVDVSDFNIPVLTSYSDNLLEFSNTINDENEPFYAVVDFSDGTQYTSSTFGSYTCPDDIIPPAPITDLVALQGPDAQSIELRFTLPGDDNYTGTPLGILYKYSPTDITTNAEFNAARTIIPVGGAGIPPDYMGAFSAVFTDINIGKDFYFAAKAYDENGNYASLSNSDMNRAWNRFSYSRGDFNAVNFSPGSGAVTQGQAALSQFDLNALSFSPGNAYDEIAIRIVNDTNTDNGWMILLDLNNFILKRARIWYPTGGLSWQPNSAQFDQNYNYPFTNGLNLRDTNLFGSTYPYGGSLLSVLRPNHVYIDVLAGISDFNLVIDNTEGTEPGFTPL